MLAIYAATKHCYYVLTIFFLKTYVKLGTFSTEFHYVNTPGSMNSLYSIDQPKDKTCTTYPVSLTTNHNIDECFVPPNTSQHSRQENTTINLFVHSITTNCPTLLTPHYSTKFFVIFLSCNSAGAPVDFYS